MSTESALWRKVTAAIVGIGLTFVTSRGIHAEPTIQVQKKYYAISGSTGSVLRKEMNQKGPLDEVEQRRFDAVTKWYIKWRYYNQNQGNVCKPTNVHVNVNVIMTLPQWNAPRNAPKKLANEWRRYINALTTHEKGHSDIGINAGRAIENRLRTFTSSSCATLETEANAAVRQIIQQFNQKDIQYDRETNHGATQGARFY